MSKDHQGQIAKALMHDPTIFMYDEIYDDIKNKPKPNTSLLTTATSKYQPKQQVQKPKYIDAMKRSTYKRQREHQIISEKMNFKKLKTSQEDQNVFVTGSFLKQQEERRKIEDQIRKQDQYDKNHSIENKDADMIAFTRYLMKEGGTDQQDKTKRETKSLKQEINIIKKDQNAIQEKEIDQKIDSGKKDKIELRNNQERQETGLPLKQQIKAKPKFYSQKNHQLKQNKQQNL